jgi:5-methylcytosine-specific restriction enzyme B
MHVVSEITYWRVGTRDGGDGDDHWPEMRSGKFVSIGWPDLGDLSGLPSGDEGWDLVNGKLMEGGQSFSSSLSNEGHQISKFVSTMQTGDIVVASVGRWVKGIGRVTTDQYHYDPDDPWPHHRCVTWLESEDWRLPRLGWGPQRRVHVLTKDALQAVRARVG